MRPTSATSPKKTKPFAIDRSQTISQILESADLNDPQTRATVVAYMSEVEEARYEAVLQKAELLEIPVRVDGPGNKVSILYDFRGEEPVYRTTMNANAAISSGANLLYPAPYSLNGTGVKVGVWDAGSVRNTHREFTTTRVVKRNSSAPLDDHATHVAGTIGALGFTASAKGMAPNVSIDSWDWNSDYAEMTSSGAASATGDATKIPLSNHSYGFGATTTDMGRYNSESVQTDSLAVSMPYYLICWAAGNEQELLTAKGGFQSITYNGLSKNILTVGAVNDAVNGGVRSPSAGTMSTFSSWGPCDDGRIKPDLVANGVSVNSPIDTSDSAYASYSGTSMATPSATGSAALLAQIYAREFSGQRMMSSLMKALLIHTADDLGNVGPDYKFGWGLINVKAAADVILAHKASLAAPKLIENSVTSSVSSRAHTFQWDGVTPIRATLCWTDPAGAAQADNSRTANLRHNLDLTITAPNGTVLLPFVMPFVGNWSDAAMNSVATTGKNNVDTVEQVYLAAPTQLGTYTITVSVDGALTTSSQAYSLVVTGGVNVEANPVPVVNITAPTNGDTVLPGSPILITATATDLTVGRQPGQVTKVEFFEGDTLLGQDTTPPYSFSWTPSTTGVRVLTAKATDNETASSVSSPVNVTVLVGDGRPMITSFAPTGGVAGDSVVILGNNLGIATSVQFGALAGAFTANNASQITATVPVNAVTAPITVSNSYGSVTSSSNFTIIPIVFREDFSSITGGNNTSPGGSGTAWAGNINFPTGVNDYEAGGAVRLGTKDASGSITSRAINLAGNGGVFKLSFKVKGWSTKEGDIKVTAGSQSQTVGYAATMSGSFESMALNFTGGTSGTTIKIETTAGRAYIDDVTVTSEAPSSPPVITSPSTAGGIAGQALFTYQITASNAPTSFGAANLPAWASINTTNGLISGPSPTAGTNVVTISASNSVGVGSTNLTITILPSGGGGGSSFSGVLAGWDTTGLSASPSTWAPVTNNATTVNMNLTMTTQLTRGSSITASGTTVANAIGGSGGWSTTPSDNTSWVFAFQANAGYSVSVTNITGFTRKSSTGPSDVIVAVSLNGGAYTNAGSFSTTSTSGTGSSFGLVLTNISSLQNVSAGQIIKFRINPSGTNGNWYILNGTNALQVSGTVSAPAAARSISVSGSLSAVDTVYGTASPIPTSFKVSCANLVAGIKIAPPAGFEVSAGNANSFAGKGNSILVGSGGTLSETDVFVRLAADTDVNTYSGNIVCSSAGASDVTVATVASTVTPKNVSVTADVLRKTYGNVDPTEFTYSATYNAPFSGVLTRDPGENVGSHRIRQGSLTAGPNFTISLAEVDFSILKKRLSITADNRTKEFGQTLTLGAGQTGFITSEMVGTDKIDTVTITASGGTAAHDAAGSYVITPSAATGGTFAAGNYELNYFPGTLTVQGQSYADWAAGRTNNAPNLDPDGNGLSNLMEYFMGINDGNPLAGPAMVLTNSESGMSMTFRRFKGLAGVNGSVEHVTDLSALAWDTNGVTVKQVVDRGTYEEVTVEVVPTPGETRKFMRLKVSQP